MTLPGVDVSSWNGVPGQWRAEAGDIAFAAVKFTEVSSAGVYQNPFAAADWLWLRQNGKARLAYAFAHPSTSVTATVAAFTGMCDALGLDDGDGVMLDHEVTDGLPAAEVSQWAADVLVADGTAVRQIARGVLVPVVRVGRELRRARSAMTLWIADPSSPAGHPRIPAPWTTFAIHQFSSAGNLDRDVAMFPDLPAMKTAIGRPAPRLAILEDPMLLEGKNIPIPVAIPDGTRALRFVAAESADVRVVFHAENGTRTVSLSWPDGSHEEPVPAGCHAAIVTRLDAGIGDVSAVCTG